MARRLVLAGSLVLALAVAQPTGAGAATHHARIRPHQYFSGMVNGSTGHPNPAIIKLVCPGPAGGTGHPLGGQSVEVSLTASTNANAGYTANAGRSISVFFGVLPPSGSAVGQLTFTRYGVSMPIPTSVTLPCSGSGVVGFLPFPRTPPISRAAVVPVVYANVAA
jgi:hypothetical protein